MFVLRLIYVRLANTESIRKITTILLVEKEVNNHHTSLELSSLLRNRV